MRIFMKKIIFTIALIFLCISNVYAQTAAHELQNKLANLHSMIADFTQTITTEDGVVLQKTFGNIAMQRPGKFRWETTTGIKQLIVTDGTKLWIYDPELKQVTIRRLGSTVGQTPILLLTGSHVDLQNHFAINKVSKDQPGDWFQLMPKNKNNAFASVVIGFENNKIIALNFTNKLEQKTVILFSKVLLNQENLPNFSFTIPQGVDVIDEAK